MSTAAMHGLAHGETVRADDAGDATMLDFRLVIAPAVGRFEPVSWLVELEGPVQVGVGTVVGSTIGVISGAATEHEVSVQESSLVDRLLVRPGQRVDAGWPVACLHPLSWTGRGG